MVWLRSDGTSLPLAMTRILPSSISLSPNGGDPQPMSICPDMTAVSVAGMPPVEVGTALDAELLAEAEHDGVGGGATGGIGDGGLLRRILEALDRRIRAHIEVDVAGAGEIRADHADRRALGEGAQHALRADIDAEIGAAGDHRLHGLARPRGAEVLERDAVFLEDAGLLPEDRRLPAPDFELADRNLELVLRECRRRRGRHRAREQKRPELAVHGVSPSNIKLSSPRKRGPSIH